VEFYNSTSNIVFVALGLYGLIRGIHIKLDFAYLFCYLAVICVGIGSFLFHGTLTWNSQLADELPMLWGDAAFLYALTPHKFRQTQSQQLMLATGLTLLVVLISAIYIYTRNAVFFESSYGVGAILITIRCATWSNYNKDNQATQVARRLIFIGTLSFLTGFFFWNLDNTFCKELRQMRKVVGWFFAPLFQYHALWHLLTGIATYFLSVFAPIVHQYDPESLAGSKKQIKKKYAVGFDRLGLPITVPLSGEEEKEEEGN